MDEAKHLINMCYNLHVPMPQKHCQIILSWDTVINTHLLYVSYKCTWEQYY